MKWSFDKNIAYRREQDFLELSVPKGGITGETQIGFTTEVALLNLTDEQLLAQALAGDEDAFTVLYRRRQGSIFRFALHMSGSSQVAEEVTQDVFVFLLQRGRDFDPSRGALGAYLFGVARNFVRRALERSYSEALLNSPAEDEEESLVTQDDPAERIARRQVSAALWKAVLSLPEHYREVVVLCDLQELSYADAAEALGCAIGTIRSRLHRAHDMLGKKLRHSAAAPGRVSRVVARFAL
jgi:RNA polymerase sigma-70 factor (ECF subfamily)